jgi:hypothetical protein
LAQDAWWHGDFVEEFVRFPNGNFDDQVDALCLAMDFFAGNPALEAPKSRALGGILNSRGLFTPAEKVIGASTANIFHRRKDYFTNIFPLRGPINGKP